MTLGEIAGEIIEKGLPPLGCSKIEDVQERSVLILTDPLEIDGTVSPIDDPKFNRHRFRLIRICAGMWQNKTGAEKPDGWQDEAGCQSCCDEAREKEPRMKKAVRQRYLLLVTLMLESVFSSPLTVQRLMKRLAEFFIHARRVAKLLKRGRFDPIEASESKQEISFSCLPNAGNLIQDRRHHLFSSELPVMHNRKPVRLVTDPL